jgi:hypothetical protein
MNLNKIDLGVLLSGEEYTPRPGLQYEVADGVWGTMRRPTVSLVVDASTATGAEDASAIDIAKMVLAGADDLTPDNAILGMAQRVVGDFFTMLRLIDEMLQGNSRPSDPSEQEDGGPE